MTISQEAIDTLCRPIVGVENRTAQEVHDIMSDRIRSFLSTLPIAGEGKVKALEWHSDEDRTQNTSGICHYKIEHFSAGGFGVYLHGYIGLHGDPLDTLDEAKAAAQYDYETRVLSALTSSPGKDGGQEVEEHAKWLEACATNEPSESDATRLCEIAQLLRSAHPQPASTALVERPWTSIKDAPRDGRDVLLTSPLWFGDALIGGFHFGAWRQRPDPQAQVLDPTHFMLIPALDADFSVSDEGEFALSASQSTSTEK